MLKCKKVTYNSYKEASQISEWLYKKTKKGRNLRPYKCVKCQKFHLYSALRDEKYYNRKNIDIKNDNLAKYEIKTNEIGEDIKAKEDKKSFWLRAFGLK